MNAYIVTQEQIPLLFAQWQKKFKLFVPQQKDKFYLLEEYVPGAEISLDYDLIYTPPKKFLFPPYEDLLEFNLNTLESKAIFQAEPQIIFGLHPYDIKAINQLDQLMDEPPMDLNYRARREQTIIMGLTPLRIAPTAFWAFVGADHVDFGFDLFWTKISAGTFLVEIGSPRGQELLLSQGSILPATSSEKEMAQKKQAAIVAEAKKQNPLKLSWQEVAKVMAKSWDSYLWTEKARKCLSCGSCNFICPTCYCFDIKDQVDDLLKTGKRYRTWDGCMLKGFAQIAGNHNFREQTFERYRHRYMRKGKYIYDRLGELGCVGCGRCVQSCPAGIANPLEVFNTLWEALQYEN